MKLPKKLLLSILTLLIVSQGWAIVSKNYTLYSSSSITSDTTSSSTVLGGATKGGSFVKARLVATNNSGTSPTADVTIEHSPQCDGNEAAASWKTLITFTQVTNESGNYEDVTPNACTTIVYPCVRVVADLGGTSPNYDLDVFLYLE